jgi:sterol desaturase/sphingolipid hydroxylase (fatty acid hydroxylase superfamily)
MIGLINIGGAAVLAFGCWTVPAGAWGNALYAAGILLAGFLLAVFGSGILVAWVMGRIVEENGLELNGLKNGGRLIGRLERALIFLLLMIGQPGGIGFLVAAKSVLRFEEAKKQPLAEYVLIGTLLSFSLAIAVSALAIWVACRLSSP